MHIVIELLVRLNINPAIKSMKTIPAPYNVSITQTRKRDEKCNDFDCFLNLYFDFYHLLIYREGKI